MSERLRRFKATSGDCGKCGMWRFSLHHDHIVPLFKGGANNESNIQLICANCHEDKSREERKGHSTGRGRKRSIEACQRISEARTLAWRHQKERGYKVSDEHRKKISDAQRGKKKSLDVRKKISAALVGVNIGTKRQTISKSNRRRVGAIYSKLKSPSKYVINILRETGKLPPLGTEAP